MNLPPAPVLEDWRDTKRRCTKCNTMYTELNNWNKACRVHLGKKNLKYDPRSKWPIGHWECCGASWNISDIHYEWKIPYGCFYMDHTTLFKPYSTENNNFIRLVPIEFESQMRAPISKDSIVATIYTENQELEYITYKDERFARIHVKPIDLPQRRLGKEQRSIDEDREDYSKTFYDDTPTFVPYYLVRRILTDRQDLDHVKYFEEKGPDK